MCFLRLLQHIIHDPVDFGISAAALLVSETAGITDAHEHESVLHSLQVLFVPAEPRNRSDRGGDEKKAVGKAPLGSGKAFRQKGSNRHSRKIVITHCRMIDMYTD